jgi:hypothetical protein
MAYLQYHIYDRALVPIYLYSIAKLPKSHYAAGWAF